MLQAPKGTRDLLPQDSRYFSMLYTKALAHFGTYGFEEIQTPIFEETALFARGIGDVTDIVKKEMYTFEDRGHRSITLRPELTASVCRSVIQHTLTRGVDALRLMYFGPMFRYERPQAGRYRQFTQLGVEVFGSSHPLIDVETIAALMAFLQPFALEGLSLHLNSIGDEQDRPAYLAYLRGQFQQRADALCGDCQRRAQENPLRVLDCKIPSCQEALEDLEPITSFLNPENRDHFDQVCQGLEDFGIRFSLNPKLVRGLDYYTKTTFELVGTHEGAQNAIMGGGRYDRLVQQLGGPDTPAFGWALGVDRLVSLLQQQQPLEERRVDLFVIADPPTGFLRHALLWQALRDKGWLVTYDSGFGSLKKQLKKANKARARYVAILGEQELKSQEITLKDLSNGQQWSLPVAQFLSHCLTQLNSATPTSGALQ